MCLIERQAVVHLDVHLHVQLAGQVVRGHVVHGHGVARRDSANPGRQRLALPLPRIGVHHDVRPGSQLLQPGFDSVRDGVRVGTSLTFPWAFPQAEATAQRDPGCGDYALSDRATDGALVMGRTRRDRDLPALVSYHPGTGQTTALFDGEWLRTGRISRGGRWMGVTRTYEPIAKGNGLYVVTTDGRARPRRLDLCGANRWRHEERLLIVPVEPGAAANAVWQVDAATGAAERLVDPAATPLRIAAGEWSVSPRGEGIAYRSASDGAIWAMTLPEVGETAGP